MARPARLARIPYAQLEAAMGVLMKTPDGRGSFDQEMRVQRGVIEVLRGAGVTVDDPVLTDDEEVEGAERAEIATKMAEIATRMQELKGFLLVENVYFSCGPGDFGERVKVKGNYIEYAVDRYTVVGPHRVREFQTVDEVLGYLETLPAVVGE